MRSLRKHRQTFSWLIVAAVLVATAGTALAAGEDESTDPTTTTAPEAPAEVPTDGSGSVDGSDAPVESQTTTEAPTTTAAPAETVAEPPAAKVYPRLPRLRCRRGINACKMERQHRRHGHYKWNNGRKFRLRSGRVIQGSRSHTSSFYRHWAKIARHKAAVKKAKARARRLRTKRVALIRRWAGVAQCETGRNWKTNTGNGYYGGLQFSKGTWAWPGYPHQYPAWKQAQRAEQIRVSSGLHHWPHCGRYYG